MFKAVNTLNALTNEGFRPIGDGDVEHFAAIGRFIHSMSTSVDNTLKVLLQFQLGIDDDIGRRALLGEMRTENVIAAIKLIASQQSLEQTVTQELASVLDEVAKLRPIRNVLAHRECMVAGDKLAFHNATHAKAEARIDISIYSLSDLNEFSVSATHLRFRIMSLFAPMLPNRFSQAKQAFLTTIGLGLVLAGVNAVLKMNGLSEEQRKEIKTKADMAYDAVTTYSNVARAIDPTFIQKERAANFALTECVTLLASLVPSTPVKMKDKPSQQLS